MKPEFKERLKQIRERNNSCYFKSRSGHKLHYLEFGEGDQIVLIFPGMGEPSLKYWELAQEVTQAGFKVFVLDHFGHGISTHPFTDPQSQRKVHIDHFDTYLQDAHDWCRHLQQKFKFKEVQVIAHSMGGQIALSLGLKEKFKSLVLSSPMFEINTKGLPKFFAKFLAQVLPQKSMAPLQKEYNQVDITQNGVTNCKDRALFYHELLEEYPQFRRFGVTNSWVLQTLIQTSQFAHLKQKTPQIPILSFQAEDDLFVRPEFNKSFCQDHPNREFILIPKAKHEILMERDEVREPVVQKIIQFIKDHQS